MSKKLLGLFVILLAAVICSPSVLGQSTAGIFGVVQDLTGAVLPGVEVTVTHVDTQRTRVIISDDEGRYRALNLNVGTYEVEASLPGFQTSARTGIVLSIGRQAVVDFTLSVGEITERVTVTGEASLIETSSGSLGDLVDRRTVLELPLNGRDLTDLLTLQAGTANVSTANSNNASRGFSQKVSISGSRPNDVSVLLDGTDVKGLDQSVPAGVSGNFIGAEAIQEFKIERNAYSAAFGGASGGVINVVSKAGSNVFHGSVYEFHRNDNMDSAAFRAAEKGEFKRNQYGFSLGGPVIENRTFFFFNFEGLKERLSLASFREVPTLDARNGILPSGPVANVDPLVLPYFDLFPLPSAGAEDLGNGITREAITKSRPTDEDFYQVRVDHQISDSDSIFVRFTYQDSERITPQNIPQWSLKDFTTNRFSTIEQQHIFSPQFLNTFRFGFNRRGVGSAGFEDPLSDTSLRFVPLSAWRAPLGAEYVQGAVNISDLDLVGLGRGWADRKTNSFEYMDDLVYQRGQHSLKFGFTWRRIQLNGDSPSRAGGEFSFDGLTEFLQNSPSRFRGDVAAASISIRGLRMNTAGWYIQDDWQVSPQLTVNLGFRHEFYTVPYEVNGLLAGLRDPLNDTEVTYNALLTPDEAWFNNPSKASLMPRVGLAWDPTGSGKTALRAGLGLFYNHIQPDTFRRAIFRTQPHALESQARGSSIRSGCIDEAGNPGASCFPGFRIFDAINSGGFGDFDLQLFPFDYMRNPHTWQWNLNVQREILPGTGLTVGYAGTRGLNQMHQTNLNAPTATVVNGRLTFPAGTEVPNQAFDNLGLLSQEASTDSYYHALQTGLQRRFQAGWQLQVSYTFSRAVDEASQINSAFTNDAGGVSYYPDPDLRRGLAAYHVANVFTASSVMELPFGPGRAFGNNLSGVAAKLLGGWQMGAILKLADGPAVTVSVQGDRDISDLNIGGQTPDLAPGASTSPVLGGADQYFDTSAFIFPPDNTLGTVGRNTLIGPGLASLDFSLIKKTRVGETVTVEFRSEFFNIFNRPNLALPDTGVFRRSGSRDSDAGRIENTTTKMREIQFGLRIVF